MAQTKMYPGVNNSIPTLTKLLITATATTIELEDATVLPPGPNLITIGTEDNAEVIRYEAIDGNKLTGCVRGYSGTPPQIWPAGSMAYRAYTTIDHQAFIDNIGDLAAAKADLNGSASDMKVTLKASYYQANVVSGETLGAMLGKIAKWFTSFGAGAWAVFGTGQGQIAHGNHTHSQYVQVDSDGKAVSAALSTKSITVSASRTLALTDACRCLDANASTGITLTIPTDAAVAFAVDTEIEIDREGLGAVTILPQSGVALRSTRGNHTDGVTVANRYGVVILKKKSANEWRVAGDFA